jgi:hypothetical protein
LTVQNKIANFYRIIINESRAKRKAMFLETKDSFALSINDFLLNETNKCEINILKEKSDMQKKEILSITSKKSLDKKNLIIKREQLKKSLFLKLENKLREFVNSDLYLEFIKNGINNFMIERENILKIEFSKSDEKNIDEINKNFNLEFCLSDDDFIGGFKLYLKKPNSVIDQTFLSKIKNEENNFNKINLSN